MAACCSHYGIFQEEMKASRSHKRVYELLVKAAGSKLPVHNGSGGRELLFVFYRNPAEILSSDDGARVAGVKLEKTVLQGDSRAYPCIWHFGCTQRHGLKLLTYLGTMIGMLRALVDFSAQYCNPSSRIAEEIVSMAGFY